MEVKSGELDFIFTLPGNFEVAFGRIITDYIPFRLAAYYDDIPLEPIACKVDLDILLEPVTFTVELDILLMAVAYYGERLLKYLKS